MNVKKAIKRIAALAAGTTMVTATIMGAMAYDLGDYPMPYVKDGVFNGNLVIGKAADVTDVIGAIDIAASLQAAAKTPVSSSGATTSVSVSGGVELVSGSDDLILGEAINGPNSGTYDADDFPELLADGTLVEDDDDTDHDYDQEISVPALEVVYVEDDDYDEVMPIYGLNIDASDYITYTVDFGSDTWDVADFDDSETLEMFGNVYTFDPTNANNADMVLFASDTTVLVQQGSPVTVEVDGEEFTLEIVGGTSDGGSGGGATVNLRVTGDSTDVESLEEGESEEIADLDIYVDNILASTIGEESIAASIFVGSDEITIPTGADDAWETLEVDGNDLDGVEVYVTSAGAAEFETISQIQFRVELAEFDDAAALDEDHGYEYVMMGETFEDPLFGFGINFAGMSPAQGGDPSVVFEQSGDDVALTFENNDGEELTVSLFQVDSANDELEIQEDLYVEHDNFTEDNVFWLTEDVGQDIEAVTKFYEVVKINFDDTWDDAETYVRLRDMATDREVEYNVGDEVGDATQTILNVSADESDFTISADSSKVIYFKGGAKLDLTALNETDITRTADQAGSFLFQEEADDNVDDATADNLTVTVGINSDDEPTISTTGWVTSTYDVDVTDEDMLYGVSEFGSLYEQEDEDDTYLNIWYMDEEVKYSVVLTGPEAVVVTSTATAGSSYNVNEFVVGQIAVYDSDAMSLIGKKPLIVVGGPCANTVAMDLMGNPEVCWEGFSEGKAVIKSFDAEQAVLVAGYSGEDTTGAAQVLADYDNPKYDLMGDEVEVIVTDLENLEVNPVN